MFVHVYAIAIVGMQSVKTAIMHCEFNRPVPYKRIPTATMLSTKHSMEKTAHSHAYLNRFSHKVSSFSLCSLKYNKRYNNGKQYSNGTREF